MMVNRRAKPYLIAGSILAVLSLSYISIRAYKGQVELDELLSDARAVNQSVGARYSHSSNNDAHEHEGDPLTRAPQHEHNHSDGDEGNSFEMDGISVTIVASPSPTSSRDEVELTEWIVYGKRTPYIEQELKRAELLRQQNERKVLQQVRTPDGQLGTVAVDKDNQYEDGDAILRSDIITPDHPWYFSENQVEVNQVEVKRSEEFKVIQDGVEYPMPDEYYTLDEYGRKIYVKKFRLSLDLDVSMDEVEAKIAAGELDVSLTDTEKKQIDAMTSIDAAFPTEEHRLRFSLLDTMTPKPSLSDLPPVNVTFKPNAEHGHALPEDRSHIDDDGFWESVLADVDQAFERSIDEPPPTPKAVPEIPISTSQGNPAPDDENRVPMEEDPPIPDNLTSETIKAKLKERLSPEQFSKAQQLLDEFGAEEGLRQFRERPPEHKDAPQHPDDKRR